MQLMSSIFIPDLQVNGELFASKVEEFNKAIFSAIAVLCGDDEIIATNDSMYSSEYPYWLFIVHKVADV